VCADSLSSFSSKPQGSIYSRQELLDYLKQQESAVGATGGVERITFRQYNLLFNQPCRRALEFLEEAQKFGAVF